MGIFLKIPHLFTNKAESGQPFDNYSEFYPFYLCEHSLPTTKLFHFVATFNIFVLLWLLINAKSTSTKIRFEMYSHQKIIELRKTPLVRNFDQENRTKWIRTQWISKSETHLNRTTLSEIFLIFLQTPLKAGTKRDRTKWVLTVIWFS